jgi:hypothetical protein
MEIKLLQEIQKYIHPIMMGYGRDNLEDVKGTDYEKVPGDGGIE